MTYLAAFVTIVKALAWPVVVVIVAFAFKPELMEALPALLRRKMAVELPGGIKATIDAAAEQQQAAVDNPATEKLPSAPALDPNPRLAASIIESRLRTEMEGIEAAKREPMLLRALALARLEAGHEFTYNRIFGSQIAALKRLNEVGHATVDGAREFFAAFTEQFPLVYSTYGFDGWLGFLKANVLIEQNDNILEITPFGRDFLIYLTERRLTEIKPL